MLSALLELDRGLFRLINGSWTHPLADQLFPLFRNAFFWAPVYLFLLFFVTLNFKKKGWWWCAFFLACFALTDSISTQVFKETFQRVRPCVDAFTAADARMLIPCSKSFGFVSSHATNHFGMAMFIFLTISSWQISRRWVVFLWAALVSYAQLYVGAHFPLDILGGALLGIIIGTLMAKAFKKFIGPLIADSNEFE
ncbi:MAG: phosphatase PAP2 family protein [Chitinophagaceae bacterium]